MKNIFSFIFLLALVSTITQAADTLPEESTTINVEESSSYSTAQFWGQIIAIIALVICSGIVAGMIHQYGHCHPMSHGTHDDQYTPSSLRICRIDTWFGKWIHLTLTSYPPLVTMQAATGRKGRFQRYHNNSGDSNGMLLLLVNVDVSGCHQSRHIICSWYTKTAEICCTNHADPQKRPFAPDSFTPH